MQILADTKKTQGGGYSICTWFYANPNRDDMIIGLRIEQRKPSRFTLHLAFKVAQYVDQLTTIGRQGNLWIVPGPPPAHLVGTTTMDGMAFIQKVVNYSGQGLFISLQENLVEELRERLNTWKQRRE